MKSAIISFVSTLVAVFLVQQFQPTENLWPYFLALVAHFIIFLFVFSFFLIFAPYNIFNDQKSENEKLIKLIKTSKQAKQQEAIFSGLLVSAKTIDEPDINTWKSNIEAAFKSCFGDDS